MTNAPYSATQQGYDNQYSGVQNLPTTTNDTRLQPQTPKAPITGDEVIFDDFSAM